VDGGRNLWLDLLRIGSAIAVFVAHQQLTGGIQLGAMSLHGLDGVYAFFVLSGHLVGGSYRPGHVREYAVRRLARILPAYYLALVGVTLLTGSAELTSNPLPYVTFTQTWLPLANGPLHPTWTLAAEMTFYALVPVLALVPRGAYLLAIPSFVIWLYRPELPIAVLWAFALGIAARRLPVGLQTAVAAGGLCLALGFAFDRGSLIAAGAAFLIRAATLRPRASTAAIAVAADLTYAFYLWQAGVLEAIPASGLALVVAGFALTAAISVTSLFLVERPILETFRQRRTQSDMAQQLASVTP
jgi:peptidoglycan/LPS O-acetylase OafA/YrhL